MVDFRQKLKKNEITKKKNPIDIYNSLDRKSITGPLRPVQETILKEWFNNRKDDKDLIIKLHTGVGKTLIGLLILQSKINSGEGPCIYVCPNLYLVQQVCAEAEKFGIKYCVTGSGTELPNEFLMGKTILITSAQKIFNGKSAFGIDSAYKKVGCIILDDSHACIDTINDAFTITISKEKSNDLYNQIINLFEEDLKEQGEGTFLDIQNEDCNAFLPIPYWAWELKKSEVLGLLSKNSKNIEVTFAWQLLKNNIEKCRAFISRKKIEISPYHIPIKSFGSFYFATNRILMSATTQNDSFFIKGLNFGIEAIKKPLIDSTLKWSGEKMLLIPSLINEELDRASIISKIAKPHNQKYGIVTLVSSTAKAKDYKPYGAMITDTSNIFDLISKLKSGEYTNTIVINNRYDGIDLPDESCRILIVDSLPYFESLNDRYEERCRISSEIINQKIAQKIEQGLGRSVRGEKDYSIILVIGSDLVRFIQSVETNKFFSSQTKKQIEIGFEIADMAKEDVSESPDNVLRELINQGLKRNSEENEGWKQYYYEKMNGIEQENKCDDAVYNVLLLESQAESDYYNGDYEKACSKIQQVLDMIRDDDWEKGWYLQTKARYEYGVSKRKSNEYQKSAFNKNDQLLKPKDGIVYKKIEYINESRIKRIKTWIKAYGSFSELSLQVNNILDNFSFGMEAEKFEEALKKIGELLGFRSQRPDKMVRKGPDNLWCIKNNQYIMFECKSEVDSDRLEISKHEAGQMNSHCGWFESEYGDAEVKRVLIIPTKTLSYYADFTHEVYIMRKGKLKKLKDNIKGFIKEFKEYNIDELSDGKIQEFIECHKLDEESLNEIYYEDYYHAKK